MVSPNGSERNKGHARPRGFNASINSGSDLEDEYPTQVYTSRALPKSVYVRRRLIVLATLIAIVAIVIIIVVGPGRAGAAKSDGAQKSGGVASEVDTDSDVADSDAETETPAAITKCAPGALAVEAVTDASDYAAGELPLLSLRVTNHGEVACDADLGTETMLFEIKSGSELYWSSKDCQKDPSSNLVRMQPGQTLETDTINWDRTRSAPDTCEDVRTEVPSGGASYHLAVEVAGEKSSNTKQFLLY